MVERATLVIHAFIAEAVEPICERLGVLDVRDHEAEAARAKVRLDEWMGGAPSVTIRSERG